MDTAEPSLLFIASEAREIGGVLRHSRRLCRLAWPLQFARAGQLSGRSAVFVANGPGFRLASEAIRTAPERMNVSAVICTGLCGGLNPALRFGDIVVARKIVGGKLGSFCPAAPPKTVRAFFPGTMVSQDRIASSVVEKRSLWDRGGDAVEMESAVLAKWAFERGVPFHCVRVVSDTAEEDFRIDLNKMRNADGHFSKLRIVAAALRRPAELAPELIRLGRKSHEAAVVLGEFLASCEF